MKLVYGNCYFAREALAEIDMELSQLYQKAIFIWGDQLEYNVVKIGKDKTKVSLQNYPTLDICPHPGLVTSAIVDLSSGLIKKFNYDKNKFILHRLEFFLSKLNPRIEELVKLYKIEEAHGLYSKEHKKKIGRQDYWNNLCEQYDLMESFSK